MKLKIILKMKTIKQVMQLFFVLAALVIILSCSKNKDTSKPVTVLANSNAWI